MAITLAGVPIPAAQPGQFFGNLRLQPAIAGLVPVHLAHALRKIVLPGGIGIVLIMRVAVSPAVAQILHETRGRIAKMRRHRARFVPGDECARGIIRDVDRVAFGARGQIEAPPPPAPARLRAAQPLKGFAGIERRCAAHADRPGRCPRLPCGQGAGPDKADRRRRPACGTSQYSEASGVEPRTDLCKRRDLVVEGIAALVERRRLRASVCCTNSPSTSRCRGRWRVGICSSMLSSRRASPSAKPSSDAPRPRRQGAKAACVVRTNRAPLRLRRLQHVHCRARQQRAVHFEGRVLGGGADEGQQALLDKRQEGVLLGLVEAVHFIHEQNGARPAAPAPASAALARPLGCP